MYHKFYNSDGYAHAFNVLSFEQNNKFSVSDFKDIYFWKYHECIREGQFKLCLTENLKLGEMIVCGKLLAVSRELRLILETQLNLNHVCITPVAIVAKGRWGKFINLADDWSLLSPIKIFDDLVSPEAEFVTLLHEPIVSNFVSVDKIYNDRHLCCGSKGVNWVMSHTLLEKLKGIKNLGVDFVD